MINLYLIGHDYEYELKNVIRVFDLNTEIEIYYEYPNIFKQNDINIISTLIKENSIFVSKVKLFDGNKLTLQNKKNSSDIEIEKADLKKTTKTITKLALYQILSKYYNTKADYGILTGVRPVKIITESRINGKNDNQIKNILKETYRVDNKKIELMFKVADIEKKYIHENMNRKSYSLYIGIPFCPTKCSYCSFTSFTKYNDEILDLYVNNLISDICQTVEIAIKNNLKLNTIYFGGGTPTVLNVKHFIKVFNVIKRYYNLNEIKEITVEAGRPDTINREKLRCIKENNVNRISINPQTMNKKTLNLIGRNHTPEEIINKFNMAKEEKFEIVNMDVIVGLPEEDKEQIQYTIKSIMQLRPENLTVHTLAFKKGSSLFKKYNMDRDSEKVKRMHEIILEYCTKFNYHPYYMYRQKNIKGNLENIGYSIKNKECIYNIMIIEEKETILGCGVGATSKIIDKKNNRIIRIPGFKNLADYEIRNTKIIGKKLNILNSVDKH